MSLIYFQVFQVAVLQVVSGYNVCSDVWNRFSALGLAGNHDSPTFRHTLQFTLQMETDIECLLDSASL